jgi:hypothetical protein
MSWITNVMLSVHPEDRQNVERLNRWLDSQAPHRQPDLASGNRGGLSLISGPDSQWGGHKAPECEVYAGVLNNARSDALVEQFGATEWAMPYAAQLFLKDQEMEFFRLWMIRAGQCLQYAPAMPSEKDDEFWEQPPDRSADPA